MKKLTVTIGIPAYNEEKTIADLLNSIVSQSSKRHTVKEILLVSDGSTDDTVRAAKKVKSNKIRIIEGRKNIGRVARRSQIIKLCKTDILVFLDADGVLESTTSLDKLIRPFVTGKNIGLVSGNPYSVSDGSFFHNSLASARDLYTQIRFKLNNGINVHSCFGSMLALSKELYLNVVLPMDVQADDSYMFFVCKNMKLTFLNVRSAKVIHNFPKNLSTHRKRIIRHNNSSSELNKYFVANQVSYEFSIPKKLYLSEVARIAIKKPIYTMSIFIINFYIKHSKNKR